MKKSTQGTLVFFTGLILYGAYLGLQPSKTVILKGIEGDVAKKAYKLHVRSKGQVRTGGDVVTKTDPPYEFTLRIMPEDTTTMFVELQDVLIYGCGEYTRLLTYDEPLIYTVDYFDYKKPMAYYSLRGKMQCHENAIMDISFILRDAGKNELSSHNERVLLEAYEYVPSTFRYWWEMAKSW